MVNFMATLRSVGADKFQQIAEKRGIDASLVKRGAEGLKKEIASQIKEFSETPLHKRVSAVNEKIEAFVKEIEEKAPSLMGLVTDLRADLEAIVEKESSRQFSIQIESSAEKVKKSYEEALKNPEADVLEVMATAKGAMGEIFSITVPSSVKKGADLQQTTVVGLEGDLKMQAKTAQVKKTEHAFKQFLENNQKRLEETETFLMSTQTRWTTKAQTFRQTSAFVLDLQQEKFEISDQASYDVTRLKKEQEVVEKEFETLHTLMSIPREKGTFSSSPVLSSSKKMKTQGEQADALFRQAKKVRHLAGTLTLAKKDADAYFVRNSDLQRQIDDTSLLVSTLRGVVRDDKSTSRIEIERIIRDVQQRLSAHQDNLGFLKLTERTIKAAVPDSGLEFDTLTAKVSNDLYAVNRNFVEAEITFGRFRAIEQCFEAGNFTDLDAESFKSVPEALYAKLKEIVEKKLENDGTPESVAAAKAYKQGIKEFLFRAGKDVENAFKLPGLERTWSEAFHAFWAWLASLFISADNENPFKGDRDDEEGFVVVPSPGENPFLEEVSPVSV